MRRILRRALNAVAYTAAGVVILMAILVGLFRLFLPRLPEYQEDIKQWANAAIGLQVEFSDMNARWRLTGPELNFLGAELSLPDGDAALIEAGEVTVGVGLLRLLFDRTLVVDRILVRDTAIEFRRAEEGEIVVQGLPVDELSAFLPQSRGSGDVVFVGEDIAVRYRDDEESAPLELDIRLVEALRREELLSLEASIDLGEGLGSRLDVSVDQRAAQDDDAPIWDVFLEGRSLGLSRWARFLPEDLAPIESGTADVSLWVQWSAGELSSATANLLVQDFSIAGADRRAPFEVDGRVEFSRLEDGYLLSADELRLRTVDGDWPRTALQLRLRESATDPSLEVQASYLKVGDLSYFSAWLPEPALDLFVRHRPTGEVRDLDLSLSSWGGEDVVFDVSAALESAGFGAHESWPGIRNFSGSLRADNNGGRLDSVSQNLRVQVPHYVSETIGFDDANGTVIWRRSGDSLTVLSDRLLLRNADVDSQSSLQITIAGANSSPIVDFESTWSVNDIASAKRFLPEPIIHPALFQWLNTALVSGRFVNGRTRLQGPLDKFPFDDGDGEFRIDATLENAVMRYASTWPDARIRNMDVVLDGMRLYTERNSAVSAGNGTTDARVEIADLRDPILEIDAFSTGSLESIRQFVLRSPIVQLFGNQLERVTVGGDASFNLLLSYPLKNREDYEFSTRIQVSEGTLTLAGFTPELSELYGIVNISRNDLDSESLFGRFLGEPVSLELSRTVTEDGGYNVIADLAGRVTTEALIAELNAPVSGLVSGASAYAAKVRFPQAGRDDSPPLTIHLESELDGFDVQLPAPLEKPTDVSVPLAAEIEFTAPGVITTNAQLGNRAGWTGSFQREDGRWDFDRGVLSLGDASLEDASLRGLHVRGYADQVDLDEWLALTRGGSGSPKVGDRIRAISLSIGELTAFGQRYVDHDVTMDRGGNRWFVRTDGEQLRGEITIPYDLSGSDAITLDMETLILPGRGDDESVREPADPQTEIDPRALPPISLKTAEFGVGERRVGAVTADFEKTREGLRADPVSAQDDSFEISGAAGWVVDDADSGRARSYITAALKSTNVAQTMERLNYDAGIESAEMELDVDVTWPGAPREDFLADLNGSMAVRLGSGQLNEIEPGAGRVFGLMSVVALPRRLSLDFRDVFDKGFGFDEIRGSFNIDRGAAYTCDLSLSGPAAEIVIIGSADLGSSEYNQTALVSANVGNTLPLVATVIGGPQVGAAFLIFSQIFKKPLQEVGQAYYGIDGPFEEPAVESADGSRFEAASLEAGCLPEST